MTVQAGLRRAVLVLSMFLTATAGATAKVPQDQRGDEGALKRWTYPNASPTEVARHSTTTGGASVLSDIGQYSTVDPFHEVVRFYVERSGFEPPDWSILGRKFPG